jgi:Na+-driven multidrug efflux pump
VLVVPVALQSLLQELLGIVMATSLGAQAVAAIGLAAKLLMHTLAIFCVGVWVKVLNMLRILGILRAGGDTRFYLITNTIAM